MGKADMLSQVPMSHILHSVFFDLKLYKVCKGKPKETWPCVQELIAGHTYNIVITSGTHISTLKPNLHPQGISMTDGEDLITLLIQYPLEIQQLEQLTYQDTVYTLSYHDTKTFEKIIPIKIPKNYRSQKITFRLAYQRPELTFPTELGKRIISIRGKSIPEDVKIVTSYQIATKVPDNVALLVISQHAKRVDDHGFRLRGWNTLRRLEDESATEYIVSVAELMHHSDDHLTILGKIRLFSKAISPNLKVWIQFLRQKWQDRFHLVLIDTTTLEIPWEMFELEPEQYLGALVKVARWIPPQRTPEFFLHIQDECYEGAVISYVDEKLGKQKIYEEILALQEVTTPYPTLGSLEDRIHNPLRQIGMIYIGCHGECGSTLQKQHPDQLTAASLAMIRKHPAPRPIAFINACESGRIQRNQWGDVSFVEILLDNCISGYIGTMAMVGTQHASRVAKHILELAKQVDGLEIAEILRRIRAEAAQCLWNSYNHSHSKRREEAIRVLYTFMYVYYGNPLARLYLRKVNYYEEEST